MLFFSNSLPTNELTKTATRTYSKSVLRPVTQPVSPFSSVGHLIYARFSPSVPLRKEIEVYINSKKTIAEGRRINISKACKNPTYTEVYDCCSHLKLPCAIESDKAYPRDFMQRGRVRIQLKREDGSLYNPSISSRKQLMLQVAELVPRQPGWTKKQEVASSSTAGPSKSGKGGRKNR